MLALPACRLLHHAGFKVVAETVSQVAAEVAGASPYVSRVVSDVTRPSGIARTFDLTPCSKADQPAGQALAERVAFPLNLSPSVRAGGTLDSGSKARKSVRPWLADDGQLVVLHPGCAGIEKPRWQPWRNAGHASAWPLEGFVQLADALRQALGGNVRVAVVGTGIEHLLSGPLCRQVSDSIDLVDQTSVRQLHALIDAADLFVGNDSGPLQLACITETPVVGLYGSSSGAASALAPDEPRRREVRSESVDGIGVAQVLAASLLAIESARGLEVREHSEIA